MTGFKITTSVQQEIKFKSYIDTTPATSQESAQIFPLRALFIASIDAYNDAKMDGFVTTK